MTLKKVKEKINTKKTDIWDLFKLASRNARLKCKFLISSHVHMFFFRLLSIVFSLFKMFKE